MKKGFIPMQGVDGWQLSNTNILATAAVNASLEIFAEAGMDELRRKSIRLTGYAEFMLKQLLKEFDSIAIITPTNPEERGCQLSIQIKEHGKAVFDYLNDHGVIADWREPNQENEQAGVIRIAPVPLYNRYIDIFKFVSLFRKALSKHHG